MTEEQFRSRKYGCATIIEYHDNRLKNIDGEYGVIIPCFIISIDFDEAIFTLIPIENPFYKECPFPANIRNCEHEKPKPKKLRRV